MIHQDARLYAGLFDGAETADLTVETGRRLYVQVARGAIEANDVALSAGDALQISRGSQLHLQHGKEAEVLVFDLPGEGGSSKG